MASTSASVDQKYKKHELRDHIYELPDTYIGSVESVQLDTFVFDEEKEHMVKKSITFVPGLYKIYDEIVVNALDQCVRLKAEIAAGKEDVRPVKNIKISINKATGVIEVMNDGDGIDVEMHGVHRVYVPQMIFGELLTSTNYDKDQEKLWSGRNGYGAKATNIFSKEFTIETIDHRRRKIYTQRFFDNMKGVDQPTIKAYTKIPYTKVKFLPDYQRFGMSGMTDDIYQLFEKRAYDACATTDPSVSVYFNEKKLDIKSFERYVDLYIGDKSSGQPRAFEVINDRWEVAATFSELGAFEQVSFVNGIATIRGGKHTDAVVAQIIKKLQEKTKKDVKAQHIKDNLMLFVKCLIVNPSFDTQTKEQLTTPVAKFGSKFELSDKFIAALLKTGVVDKAASLTEFTDKKKLAKTDGKKTCRVLIPNLDDANFAGTKRSQECTLILTEGLSAKTTAVSGLSVVGRDLFGIFPLRGKILNVNDAQAKRIAENEEISHLKKILGLQAGKVYKDMSELRYGSIMIMTDADHDGSHIKGLLFLLFKCQWPSLYQHEGFITSMLTPIVKAARTGAGGEVVTFYNLHDFERWRDALPSESGWKIRYLKGLGTSTDTEAKEYFREMKRLVYKYTGEESDKRLDLAFNGKRADDRKSWLMQFQRNKVLDVSDASVPVPYESFVDEELIHFSNRDLERSINHLCDGLKESTRKIMFGCFKRKLYTNAIKVAQLAAYIAEVSAYHHGETSLQQAITGMASVYVGKNNINLLTPEGQFGTRLSGGKDAASPRYIFTALSQIAKLIYREEDLPILTYLNDDGISIEPEYYIPIIPMILVNGGLGIATGFSTKIACHNPTDIIGICKSIADARVTDASSIDELELPAITPWYLGFKGIISLQKPGVYQSRGIYTWNDDTTVTITELPVGVWTDDYKEYLTELLLANSPVLKDFETHCTSKNVKFILKFYPGTRSVVEPTFDVDFKLASSDATLNMNNIHLLNPDSAAVGKYRDTTHVIKEWAKVRLVKYVERKDHQLKTMRHAHTILAAKVRFIQEIIDKTLNVMNVKIAVVEQALKTKGYPTSKEHGEGEGEGEGYGDGNGDYKYLTKMPIHQLTAEKKAALEKQAHDLMMRIEELEAKPIHDIWKSELAELGEAWNSHRGNVEADMQADLDNKRVVSKTPKKRVAAAKK